MSCSLRMVTLLTHQPSMIRWNKNKFHRLRVRNYASDLHKLNPNLFSNWASATAVGNRFVIPPHTPRVVDTS